MGKQNQNWYLNYLLNPSFQEVNRLFVFSFADNAHKKNLINGTSFQLHK